MTTTTEEPSESTLIHEYTGIPLDAAGLLEQREFQWGIISHTGIVLKDETPKMEILRLIEMALGLEQRLAERHCEIVMKCCDLLNFAEDKLGEEYAQAVEGTRKALNLRPKTLENAMWIFSKVPPHLRRPEALTVSHHEAVAKLPVEEQAEFLRLADCENWTVNELKKEIAKVHPGKPRGPKATIEVKINTDNPAAVLDALVILVDWIAANQDTELDGDAWEPPMKAIYREYRRRFMGNGHAKKTEQEAAS